MKRSAKAKVKEFFHFSKKNGLHHSYAAHRSKRAMKYVVWKYFLFFTALIITLIWLFQYVFLDSYYQAKKIRGVSKAADKIIQAYGTDDQENTNRMLAFNNNFCIVITDENGNYLSVENNLGAYSYLFSDIRDNNSMNLFSIISELKKSGKDNITQISENDKFRHREILYCTKIENSDDSAAYLFIESSIQPIDSTVSIIREQLFYITVIIIDLAFVVSLFISRRLAKPIHDITQTAKKFKDGDYDVEFKGQGYLEIEELSNVLNDARNEIRKVSDLRKDLIANVSHDLRTPLTMVKAYAEMIRDLSGDNPVKRAEHIQVIIDEADRLSNLVNNLLELSKLESGNIELNVTRFSITQKLRDCMTRYNLMVEQNGYDIKFIEDEDRDIMADCDKLDQVIYNFINNAINYTGEEKVIRVKQINKDKVVRIEVSDNGSGISKELLPKVFDRYYRDAKTKRDVVGTGLGLSICKEILKKHDFSFGVQSEVGKGSTFWFEAPIAKHEKNEKNERKGSKLPN